MQWTDLENAAPSQNRNPAIDTHEITKKLDGRPQQFDRDFFMSVINPLPTFLPMTSKRGLWWFALLSCITGYGYLEYRYNLSGIISERVSENITPLMIFYIAYEPVMLTVAMLFSIYPTDAEYAAFVQENLTTSTNPIPRNPELAILIPCHNSADCIAKTVRSCLAHTAPERIFIMDNGRDEQPSDNTKDVVHTVNSRVRYFYLEKTANKTIALLVGAQYVKNRHPNLKFTLIIDDDVLIPPEFKVRQELFEDPCVRGIVYPIRSDSPYAKEPLISRHQDLEYKIADLEMAFLDRTTSVIRPHGAASLWYTSTLIDVLFKHNAIFKGDDVMMGHILQHLHLAEGNAKLRIDMYCHFKTTVPQTHLGSPPNLYQQRVHSWSEAQFLYPWNLSIRPLLTVWNRPPLALLSIKNSQLYNLHTQLIHIIRYPVMIMSRGDPFYWSVLMSSMALQCTLVLVFNYAKLPPRLRSDWLSACTFPIYKSVDATMGTLAFLRVLFASGASAPNNPSVRHMLLHHHITLPDSAPSPQSPMRSACSRHRLFSSPLPPSCATLGNTSVPNLVELIPVQNETIEEGNLTLSSWQSIEDYSVVVFS